LAAPFAMVRAERRQRHEDEEETALELEPAKTSEVAVPTDEDRRAAKLLDRYGRAVR
jgi:hypothetical protein